jgi:hypothetical protein
MIRPSFSGQQPERMLSDPKPVPYRKSDADQTGQAPPVSARRRASRGQATQVLSHGRHHHNRLSVVSQPSSSGLNATAG